MLNDDGRIDAAKDPIPGHILRPDFIREPAPRADEADILQKDRDDNNQSGAAIKKSVLPPESGVEPQCESCPYPRADSHPQQSAGEEEKKAPDTSEHGEGVPPAAGCVKEQPKNPLKSLFASIMPPGIGCRGDRGDGKDFGFEELLIIGLILLLAQNDSDNDILLILALLLFFQ
jgi:hypothetical protein